MNRKLAVLGLGIENLALVKYLAGQGNEITVCDSRDRTALGERYELLTQLGVNFRLGPDYLERLEDFDTVFRSPGLPLFQPELRQAEAKGVEVTSAMRLFLDLCPCPTIGVTGSKGKGTTSTLIHRILTLSQAKKGFQAFLGGNIGIAPFEFLPRLKAQDRVVLELSSFQLEDCHRSVDIAVITNITEDHLAPADPLNPNYHKSRADYVRAKTNIFRHQSSNGVTILNMDDPTSRGLTREVKGLLLTYGNFEQAHGAWYTKRRDGGYTIWWNPDGRVERLIESEAIQVRGEHNLLNISAAALASRAAGADNNSIYRGISDYKGLEHRLEYVATVNGIQYFDDSFATAPDPTMVALKAFHEPIVLIAGGADKGADFSGLAEAILKSTVHTVVLIGLTGPKIGDAILQAATRLNLPSPRLIDGGPDMESIVATASARAASGEIVLLSTACASFGMFKNYKERGDLFKQAVMKL